MTRIVLEHLVGFAVVLLASLLFISFSDGVEEDAWMPTSADWSVVDSIDVRDPMQFTLLRETMSVFYDREPGRVAALTRDVQDSLRRRAALIEQSALAGKRGLNGDQLRRLGGQYLSFIAVYIVSMAITVVAARVGAILKYLGARRRRAFFHRCSVTAQRLVSTDRSWRTAGEMAALMAEGAVRSVATIVLFSPAYVVAYAIKPGFETDNLAFMVGLTVVTNGVLIGLANTFTMILLHERRKGYVETARVKGLSDIATSQASWLDSVHVMLWPMSKGKRDVFHQVYANARLQCIPAIKRHASFMITGLIIVEMALNVQGQLCYTLMQSVLFGDTTRAVAIVVGIYALVKATELIVDVWQERQLSRYRNGAAR